MAVEKDPSGRRAVQVEVEVPGTPEEVWQAIATAAGVTSWFVPTRTEHDADGTPTKMICNFGPGMDSISTITEWNPPHLFASDSKDLGEEAPVVATQWIVEARDNTTCIVRVVHSLFASTDDWDDQLEGWENGWPSFFRLLKLYLTHFRGLTGHQLQLTGFAARPREEAWAKLMGALGIEPPKQGGAVAATGSPPLGGVAEIVGQDPHAEEMVLRLDTPTKGIAHLFAMEMGGQVVLPMRFYLYGDEAEKTVAEISSAWQEWCQQHFQRLDGSEEGLSCG